MKKILYLHQYFNTNNQNGSTRSYEITKFLQSEGYDVTVITGKPVHIDEDINIIATNTQYFNSMSFGRRIISFFHYNIMAIYLGTKIKDIDIIFATSTPLTIAIPAIILKKIKKTKLIFEVRDVWPDVPIELGFIKNKILIKILKWFEKYVYDKSEKIIPLSKGMYHNILNKNINKDKLHCITNIANIEQHKYYVNKREHFKKELGYKDKFLCTHFGAMGYANGLDFILDTAKMINDDTIHFLLIGEGKEKYHLLNRVKNEHIRNVMILESMPKKEVLKYFAITDIGLVVFRQNKILEDNSANKFFDYLASGKPILINYEGWQKEDLLNYQCGFSELTPKDMANKIEDLKNDSKQGMQLGENSLLLAQNYSLNTVKIKLKEIFDSLYYISKGE